MSHAMGCRRRRSDIGGFTTTVCALVVTVSLLAFSGRALADGAAGDVAPSTGVRAGEDRPTRTIEDLAARVNATRAALAAKEHRGRGLYSSRQQYSDSCQSHNDCAEGEYCDGYYGRKICRPCAFCEITTDSAYPYDGSCPGKCYCSGGSSNSGSNCNWQANCQSYWTGSNPHSQPSHSSVYMCEPYSVSNFACYEHNQCVQGDFCASSGGAVMNNFCARCDDCETDYYNGYNGVSHNGVCPGTCLGCDHLIDPEGYTYSGKCGAFFKQAEEHWCGDVCYAWTKDDCCDPNPGVIAGAIIGCVAGLTGIILLIAWQCGCCCFNKRMGPRVMRAQPRFIMGQQPQFVMGQQPQYAMAPQAAAMQQPQYVVANAGAQQAQIAQAVAQAQAQAK